MGCEGVKFEISGCGEQGEVRTIVGETTDGDDRQGL